MEGLHGVVCTESYDGQEWMPRVVGGSRYHTLVLEVDEDKLSVAHNHSACVLKTHVEHHVACSVVLIGVAIDTLPLDARADLAFVVDGCLLEIGEVSLHECKVLEAHECRRKHAKRDVWVDFFLCNINPGKHFPIHVQEAMLFGVYELKMEGINLSFVKFDQRVVDRYKAFFERLNQYSSQGMNEKQIGAALRPEFGDTYMWDYYVLREVQTN